LCRGGARRRRFSADSDNRAAEFAITLLSDWKGDWVGHLLATRLIQLARQRGIDPLVGKVLPENVAGLQLRRQFGFAIGINPSDPELLRVGKMLHNPFALPMLLIANSGARSGRPVEPARSRSLMWSVARDNVLKLCCDARFFVHVDEQPISKW
jgi:hypothetical protein